MLPIPDRNFTNTVLKLLSDTIAVACLLSLADGPPTEADEAAVVLAASPGPPHLRFASRLRLWKANTQVLTGIDGAQAKADSKLLTAA